jgi:coatomer subunit beta'
MHKHHYIPLQIWNLGSPDPNFTLDAHQKGVNCVDYFTGGDKPYLITGSDDHTAKVGVYVFCFLYSSSSTQ